MVPEDLLFWVDTFHPADGHDTGVLCRRHSDAMVVPRGWTLDDRREPQPRLFRPTTDVTGAIPRSGRRRAGTASQQRQRVQQLELPADEHHADAPTDDAHVDVDVDVVTGPEPEMDRADAPWMPDFDDDDDLDGLLHVDSPLLARAFRGTGRTR